MDRKLRKIQIYFEFALFDTFIAAPLVAWAVFQTAMLLCNSIPPESLKC